MKKLIIVIALGIFMTTGVGLFPHVVDAKTRVSTSSFHIVKVKGYTKKSGTYVAPHFRTLPDRKKINNWSTKGNVNPFTGKKGIKRY